MEYIDLLRNIWFVLLGVLFAGYAILDGFDLGVGTLLPFIGRDRRDTESLTNSIWPFWDGNEVWLLTAGGAMFAAFPDAYATVFSGFYLAIMLVIFCLILRAVSIEFMRYDEARYGLWRGTFVGSSALVSLLFGVALGNVIVGVPLDGGFQYRGDFLHLLRPFPLVVGLLGLAAIMMQGAAWSALKSDGDLRNRARRALERSSIAFSVLFIAAGILAFMYLPGYAARIPAILAAVVTAAAWVLSRKFSSGGRDGLTFAATSVVFAGLWGITGSLLYPDLVRDSAAANSITITNASSSELTLTVMLVIALMGMPLVVGYTIWVYRVFRGKTTPEKI